MINKRFMILAIALVMLVLPASAAITINWDPHFNFGGGVGNGGDDYAHYNTSTQMQRTIAPNTTAWEFFWAAGLLALGLFLLSLLRPQISTMDLEVNGIISVLAWVPSGFCAFAAFSIDRLAGYGVTGLIANTSTLGQAQFNNHEYVYMENHLIYSEPLIGLLMIVFTFVCIANTFRIVAQHRALLGQQERDLYE